MDDKLTIYQLNAQSADKLDERRDISTRAFGAMSVAITAVAIGVLAELPLLSVTLCVLLCVVAVAWLATLDSLTAKLKAKNQLLTQMEAGSDFPIAFLTQERRVWDTFRKTPLDKALRCAPWAFLALGVVGLLSIPAYLAWTCVFVAQ